MHPTHAEGRKRMLPAPELGQILFQGGLDTAAKLWPLLSLLICQVLFPRSLQSERRLAPSIAGLSLHYLLYSTLLLASASRNSISPTSLQRVAIIPFFLIVTVMIFVFFFQIRRPSSLPLPRTGHTPVILPRFLAAPRFRQRRSIMHLSRLYARRISLGEQDNNSGNRLFFYIYAIVTRIED